MTLTRAPHRQILLVLAAAFALALSAGAANAWTLKTLHSFCAKPNCVDGQTPSHLLMDRPGHMFGLAESEKLFELTRNERGKWIYKNLGKLHSFSADSPLILDAAGNVYSTASQSGRFGSGAAFMLSPPQTGTKWTFDVIHSFCRIAPPQCPVDGSQPEGGLTYFGAETGVPYDGVSPLYGTTDRGGNSVSDGIFYQLVPHGSRGRFAFTTLYRFCSQPNCADGNNPSIDGLVPDTSGNLLGTTRNGGTGSGGVIFELTPVAGQWTETTLYNFCSQPNCTDGSWGEGGLLQDSNGALFGTTANGGTCQFGCGVLFKFDRTNSQYSVLHSFCSESDCTDGTDPVGGVIMDSSGTLYGTTSTGGGHDIDVFGKGGGTVYSVSNGNYQVIYAFCAQANCTDGEIPIAPLVSDGSGNLYGTTEYGGTVLQGGTVFELSP